MASNALTPAYAEFLEYLLTKMAPEDVLTFKVSEGAQARADELTGKNKAGTLSENEEAELQQLLEFEMMFSVLKAKAVVALKNK